VVLDERSSEEPGRVVVGVDGSDAARAALVWGIRAAAQRGARVEAVSAFPVDFYWTDAYVLDRPRADDARTATESRTRALVDDVRGDPAVLAVPGGGDVPVEVVAAAGPAAEQLIDRSQDAELLVVGSRGRGAVAGALLGSVSLRCVMHARCPVVVVHGAVAPAAGSSTVVVGVDGSPSARAALATAAQEARRFGDRLRVVTAFRTADTWSDVPELLELTAAELRSAASSMATTEVADVLGAGPAQVPVDVVAVEGPPVEVLVGQAAHADLLVVGSRGHGTLPGLLLGSVALRAAVRSECPVMVVHPTGAAAAGDAPARTSAATV
jgi:nucleotide-binding universal stress UspA family protein